MFELIHVCKNIWWTILLLFNQVNASARNYVRCAAVATCWIVLIGFLALVIALLALLLSRHEIPVCDAMACYTAFLSNIYGFYSRGIIMMVLRGGLIHAGHHWRPATDK